MGTRSTLHSKLKTLLGTSNVYFQPPESITMKYPCIVYERSNIKTSYAGNNPYNSEKRYTITVIDANPDSAIPDKIAALQKCIFDRHFTADGFNHDVFNLYF